MRNRHASPRLPGQLSFGRCSGRAVRAHILTLSEGSLPVYYPAVEGFFLYPSCFYARHSVRSSKKSNMVFRRFRLGLDENFTLNAGDSSLKKVFKHMVLMDSYFCST